MATHRYYLCNVTAPYTPATKRGAWDLATASSIRRIAPVSEVAAASRGAIGTYAVSETSADGAYDVLVYRAVSAGLIAGDVTVLQAVIGFFESDAPADMYPHLHIFVTQGDSDSVRGTILSDFIGPTEMASAFNVCGYGMDFSSVAGTVSVTAGDRLVVELGYRATNTSASSMSGNVYRGGTSTTDLSNGGPGNSYPSWIDVVIGVPSPPTILTNPQFQDVVPGRNATFTASANDGTCQWQELISGTWTDVSGATSGTLTLTAPATTAIPRWFRAAFTSAYGTTYTSAAPMWVVPPYIGRHQAVRDAFHAGTRIRIGVITGLDVSAADSWTALLDAHLKTKNAASDVVVYGSPGDKATTYAAYAATLAGLSPKPDLVLMVAGIQDHIAQTVRATYRTQLKTAATVLNNAGIVPVFQYDNDYASSQTGTIHLVSYFDSAEETSATGAFSGHYLVVEDTFARTRCAPRANGFWSPFTDARDPTALAALLGVDGRTPNTDGAAIVFDALKNWLKTPSLLTENGANPHTGQGGGVTTGENSLVVRPDTTMDMYAAWWDADGIFRLTASSPYTSWSAPDLLGIGSRFEPSDMRADDGNLYMACKWGYAASGDTTAVEAFYLYRSTDDGDTWDAMNNGDPVLTLGQPYYGTMRCSGWNPMIWVDTTAKRLHLVYDAFPEYLGMTPEGIGYSYVDYTGTLGTSTALDFSTNILSDWLIAGGGTPTIQKVPGRGWLMFMGWYGSFGYDEGYTNSLSDGTGSGVIHTTMAFCTDDPGDPANWKRSYNLEMRFEGVHIGDPAMIELPDSTCMVTFSASQTPNISSADAGVWQAWTDLSLAEFFDTLSEMLDITAGVDGSTSVAETVERLVAIVAAESGSSAVTTLVGALVTLAATVAGTSAVAEVLDAYQSLSAAVAGGSTAAQDTEQLLDLAASSTGASSVTADVARLLVVSGAVTGTTNVAVLLDGSPANIVDMGALVAAGYSSVAVALERVLPVVAAVAGRAAVAAIAGGLPSRRIPQHSHAVAAAPLHSHTSTAIAQHSHTTRRRT